MSAAVVLPEVVGSGQGGVVAFRTGPSVAKLPVSPFTNVNRTGSYSTSTSKATKAEPALVGELLGTNSLILMGTVMIVPAAPLALKVIVGTESVAGGALLVATTMPLSPGSTGASAVIPLPAAGTQYSTFRK